MSVAASTVAGAIPPLPDGPEGPAHTQAAAAPADPPARVIIPSIGVDSSLESLRIQPDGTLAAPTVFAEAGWYAGGVRPGDPGPAVIAGHVDSRAGPAVFFRLKELRAGAHVTVQQSSGRTVDFVVDGTASYPKSNFPSEAVYGPTPTPVLRLITCTGEFDYAHRNYLSNLVVSAHLVGS